MNRFLSHALSATSTSGRRGAYLVAEGALSLARAAVVMSRDYAQAETFQAAAAPLKAAHLVLHRERAGGEDCCCKVLTTK